ncbi:hypothetical protein [Streptomyces chrestomyceticus]|uniref:hypothetical protein n=1 Tax=Streptomyces chrestomyceticus TaxID=68185 RepID=UPI0033F49CED
MVEHMRQSWKSVVRASGVVAAGAALLVGVTGGTAHAAVGWNAQYTAGDIGGAHAWGAVDAQSRVFVKVNLKDSKPNDAYGARVYLKARYSDGGTRAENLSVSGGTKSTTWNFAANVVKIEVQECTTKGGSKYKCASGWHTLPRG